jgi:Hydroxymethylglutaryl-coenzyme A synthase C terminal
MADTAKELFRRCATAMQRRDVVRLTDLEQADGPSLTEIGREVRRLKFDPADWLLAAAAAGLLPTRQPPARLADDTARNRYLLRHLERRDLSQASPGAKALVIATDISRFLVTEGGDALTMDWTFLEPSGGAGAVAMLVSEKPEIFDTPRRIGCFSYGSGCSSEFYSGVATAAGQQKIRALELERHLDDRHQLTMDEYLTLLEGGNAVRFGTRDVVLDTGLLPAVWQSIRDSAERRGAKRLFLTEIKNFHRQYAWAT